MKARASNVLHEQCALNGMPGGCRLRVRARLAGLQVAEDEEVVADLLHLRSAARSTLTHGRGDQVSELTLGLWVVADLLHLRSARQALPWLL